MNTLKVMMTLRRRFRRVVAGVATSCPAYVGAPCRGGHSVRVHPQARRADRLSSRSCATPVTSAPYRPCDRGNGVDKLWQGAGRQFGSQRRLFSLRAHVRPAPFADLWTGTFCM